VYANERLLCSPHVSGVHVSGINHMYSLTCVCSFTGCVDNFHVGSCLEMVDSSLFDFSALTGTNMNVCFVTLDNKTSFTSRYFMKMSNIRNGYPMSLTKVYLAVCSLKVYVNICIFFALLADDVLSCPHRLLRMICVYHVQL